MAWLWLSCRAVAVGQVAGLATDRHLPLFHLVLLQTITIILPLPKSSYLHKRIQALHCCIYLCSLPAAIKPAAIKPTDITWLHSAGSIGSEREIVGSARLPPRHPWMNQIVKVTSSHSLPESLPLFKGEIVP